MSGSLNIASPTGQETVRADGTGALLSFAFLSQMRDAAGYTKSAPTSGSTLTFAAGQSVMFISGSGTISALTVVTGAAPVDGQIMWIVANQAVSTLTMTANTGQTLNSGATSLTQNVPVVYLYSSSNTTWDRIL